MRATSWLWLQGGEKGPANSTRAKLQGPFPAQTGSGLNKSLPDLGTEEEGMTPAWGAGWASRAQCGVIGGPYQAGSGLLLGPYDFPQHRACMPSQPER